MPVEFKPMLAATPEDDSDLRFPYLASPKLDGIRCVIREGIALSRNLKPIRNKHIQRALSGRPDLEGLDGELIVGDPTDPLCFSLTTSGVMSAAGEPDFAFHVFDNYLLGGEFALRYERLARQLATKRSHKPVVRVVPHQPVHTLEELLTYEKALLAAGYEGVMLRAFGGPYKQGRATVRENYLLKLKRFSDGEGTVVDVLEGSHNINPATKDELGRTKRSSAKAGKVAAGVVGTLVVRDLKNPELVMHVGPGVMTAQERAHYWRNQHELKGRIVRHRSFHYGAKDLPRFPTFQGFRDEDDL